MKKILLTLTVLILGGVVYYYGFHTSSVYNGIDISHHNKVKWNKLKNENLEFCYIKATEGKSFKDPKCVKHSLNAKKIGLNVGLYHYFRTDVSAKKQFDNFMSVYNAAYSNLIPAIDVEECGNNFNDPKAKSRLLELVSLFEKTFKTEPVIYIGSLSCAKYIPALWQCPLWLRAVKCTNYIPNTAIKQTAVINNLDRNYCRNVNKLIMKCRQ